MSINIEQQSASLVAGANITLSTSGNTITIIGSADQGVGISAGTQSVGTGTVIFSNSNNFTFGMSGSSRITASYTTPVVSNAIASVGSVTNSGTNTSRFAADDHIHAGVFSVGVSTGGNTLGDTRVGAGQFVFAGGNNVTLSQATAAGALNTITVSAGGPGGAIIFGISAGTQLATSGTVIFSNSNNMTFGMSNSSIITASYTAPVVSNAIQAVAAATNSGTNTSRFAADDHVHAGIFSAGVTSLGNTLGDTLVAPGRLVFVGGNNITLSQATAAGSLMTISIAAAADLGVAISAGTQSANTGTIIFSNSNFMTFGMAGSQTVTASYTAPVVSNAIQSVGTATNSGTNTSRFAADDHIHAGQFGWDVNGIASTFIGTQQLSAGALISIITGGNTTRGSAQIVNLVSSATTVSAVGSANVVGAMASRFALEGHIHAGVFSAGVSNVGNTAGDTGVRPGQIVFAGSNALTVSQETAAGSLQTVHIQGPLSATTISQVSNANSIGTRGSRFALEDHYHAGVPAIAAGSNTGNTLGNTATQFGSWVIAGTDNITVSGSTGAGGIHTAWVSANAGGAAFPNLNMWANDIGGGTQILNVRNGTLGIAPMGGNGENMFPGNMTVSTLLFAINNNAAAGLSTAVFTVSFSLGFYTLNGSSLSLLNSCSTSFGTAASNTSITDLMSGPRFFSILTSQWSTTPTFSQTQYWLGYVQRTSGENAGMRWGGFEFGDEGARRGTIGQAQVGGNSSYGLFPFHGNMSVSTAAMPVSLERSQIDGQNSEGSFMPMIRFHNVYNSF